MRVFRCCVEAPCRDLVFRVYAVPETPELGDAALVVTSERGWHVVATHLRIQIAVAARSEVADRPVNGVLTVVPVTAGDLASGYGGKDGDGFDLVLERPGIYAFRDALAAMGVEESDARRLALAAGRSWTVLRRRLASNPAIRSPAWLQLPGADALATLCLLRAWHGGKEADRAIVERLAGEPYVSVERKLRTLSQADDAPVIAVGKVWRAKSPLELLDLYADCITADELGRFFEIVESLLVQPDPCLELDPDQRWMAPIYGKVREESGLLLESVCDTLVKLSVRGSGYPELAAQGIEYRVAHLVERLLGDADGARWLSLASHLRPLAEAAPDAFLRAVESSLDRPDAPVERLFSESASSEKALMGGYRRYVDLVWALEILAWPPRWMPRVASILARLSPIPLRENWRNRPSNSLLDIIRAWWPRTAASLAQRIAVLDNLVETEPYIAFQLLDGLLHTGPDFASPSADPVWRDDDASAGGKATGEECYGMLAAAADRMIALAQGHAQRLVRLLKKLSMLDADRADKVLSMVAAFTDAAADDLDRERLQQALRIQLHWHSNYGKRGPDADADSPPLERWRQLYDALRPEDPVIRHRWLLQENWIELPVVRDSDHLREHHRREEWRKDALREVYRELGLEGVARLAESCGDAFIVGYCLLDVVPNHAALPDWITHRDAELALDTATAAMVSGIVRLLDEARTAAFLRHVVRVGTERRWTPERIAAFLGLARDDRLTWDLAQECGDAVESAYWRGVSPRIWQGSSEDRAFVIAKLLAASRPMTALASAWLTGRRTRRAA